MSTPPTPLIVLGGVLLAAVAGCVNAVGFLSMHHQAVTHLSGTVSIIGTELARNDFAPAGKAALVILGFFAGATLSSYTIRQNVLKFGRRYGGVLMLEGVLLVAACFCYRLGWWAGDALAAMACGMQNAMATSYSGSVIRTTHVTGTVTDLGIACGRWLRGQTVDHGRVILLASLLLGFLTGSFLGAVGFAYLGYKTLLIPAAIVGVSGAAHTAWLQLDRARRPREFALTPAK